MPDTRGAFRKFEVTRTDERDLPGEKHEGCAYFVLDLDHDENAPAALRAYAESCKNERPELSKDLIAAVDEYLHDCGCREAHCPHEPPFGWPTLGQCFVRRLDEEGE